MRCAERDPRSDRRESGDQRDQRALVSDDA